MIQDADFLDFHDKISLTPARESVKKGVLPVAVSYFETAVGGEFIQVLISKLPGPAPEQQDKEDYASQTY